MIFIPKRRVLGGVSLPNCVSPIKENANQNVRVSYLSCCIREIRLCIAQNADKMFSFTDSESVDYSLATEITFDVWEDASQGTLVLSKSLSGGSVILVAGNIFTIAVTGAESGVLSPTVKYCEAWVTLIDGKRRCVGAGQFEVIDTRKHD